MNILTLLFPGGINKNLHPIDSLERFHFWVNLYVFYRVSNSLQTIFGTVSQYVRKTWVHDSRARSPTAKMTVDVSRTYQCCQRKSPTRLKLFFPRISMCLCAKQDEFIRRSTVGENNFERDRLFVGALTTLVRTRETSMVVFAIGFRHGNRGLVFFTFYSTAIRPLWVVTSQ